IDGPDLIAPGSKAHYIITLDNTTDADWPATTRIAVAGGAVSELYDAASWTSAAEVGTIGVAIPAGSQGVLELVAVAPKVDAETPTTTELALTDGATQVGSVLLSVTVTPNGDENLSSDSGDHNDTEITGGCAAGGGAGWLALAPLALVLRRRRLP